MLHRGHETGQQQVLQDSKMVHTQNKKVTKLKLTCSTVLKMEGNIAYF
jgi:hypothetical protein